MALPASMTTAKSSSKSFNNDNSNNQFNEGKSRIASKSYGGENNLNSRNNRVDRRTGDDNDKYDNGNNEEEVEGDGEEEVEVEERRDIDDDEVLRILSLLGGEEEGEGEEGEEIEGNENDILTSNGFKNNVDEDEEDDDDYYEEERPIDPSKQLQQRLKGVYSRRKNNQTGSGRGSGRGSLIGDVVFDVVDNKGRVRDIRKSQLSDPPSAPKVSLSSSPLTELSGTNSNSNSNSRSRNEKYNFETSYSSTAYQTGLNKKAGGTVADALEALKNPFFIPPKSRESSHNRGTGLPGIPGESIVSTNSRLRALATRPVGGSYEGEEVDRALR